MKFRPAQQCYMHLTYHEFEVPDSSELEYGLARWRAGESIQDALPMLTADQQEILKTGTCGEAWDTMFVIEDDEMYGSWGEKREDENIDSVDDTFTEM